MGGAFRRILAVAALAVASAVAALPAAADPLAKDLFGAKRLPTATAPKSYGFYSKGCIAGAVAIPADGPAWQAMRLSRNRRWGHPAMIRLLERFAADAKAQGWPGLLLGDISQPRGGPMLDGHASHQIGLDADIWFTPMPERKLSAAERERIEGPSMIKRGGLTVDENRWTESRARLLKLAASYPQVERILVHPGIKKKLCDTVKGDRSWLAKVRPFWGHDQHFHIRIGCQPGSEGCKGQAPVPSGEGCGKELAWWFTPEPWRPNKNPDAPKARDVMTLKALPAACQAVLAAPAPASEAVATLFPTGPEPLSPSGHEPLSPSGPEPLSASGPEPGGVAAAAKLPQALGFAPTPETGFPLPSPRPGS